MHVDNSNMAMPGTTMEDATEEGMSIIAMPVAGAVMAMAENTIGVIGEAAIATFTFANNLYCHHYVVASVSYATYIYYGQVTKCS
jgi:hypothetical protein